MPVPGPEAFQPGCGQGKPAPDIYIKAIQDLGLRPEQCLIVEDNENGIRAARASGAHVLKCLEKPRM